MDKAAEWEKNWKINADVESLSLWYNGPFDSEIGSYNQLVRPKFETSKAELKEQVRLNTERNKMKKAARKSQSLTSMPRSSPKQQSKIDKHVKEAHQTSVSSSTIGKKGKARKKTIQSSVDPRPMANNLPSSQMTDIDYINNMLFSPGGTQSTSSARQVSAECSEDPSIMKDQTKNNTPATEARSRSVDEDKNQDVKQAANKNCDASSFALQSGGNAGSQNKLESNSKQEVVMDMVALLGQYLPRRNRRPVSARDAALIPKPRRFVSSYGRLELLLSLLRSS